MPAFSALIRSRADRAARNAVGSCGSRARSSIRLPMKWPWQSHSPGSTVAALRVTAPGAAGAPAAGPA